MRNGIYTNFNGLQLPVNTIRDNEDEIQVRFEGDHCPFPGFEKSRHEANVYFLLKKISDIKEAWYVKTFGIYKGHTVQVFSSNGQGAATGRVMIGTNNPVIIQQLGLYGDDKWGFAEPDFAELDSLWEERTTVFGLPLPNGTDPLFLIK